MADESSLAERLWKLRNSPTVIVGIGNTLKGDDGAGPRLCEKLKQANLRADVMDVGAVPENYIQPIISKLPRNLLVVDAADFGAQPGTIKTFKPEQLDNIGFSTHTLSPRLFIDMVKAQLDVEVCFIGIQVAQTRTGSSLSHEVASAVETLCRILVEVFGVSQ